MNIDDLKGMKYFLLYSFTVIAFFVYSGMTGWKWFNATKTESTRPTGRTPYIYRYHK